MSTQFALFGARRFMPLFATQTLGAFNDNLFKMAFVMLVTYGTAIQTSIEPGALAAIAGGALIAPFFLFSATAGELADRFERARLLQILKAAELVTVLAAIAALLADSLALCFLSLFALGAQATFSSPVRYALLPQHLAADELVGGNALLEGGTFLSILLGTIAGGLAVARANGTELASLLLVVCAVGGFAASLGVPPAPAPSPGLVLSRNLFAATADILRHAWQRRDVKLSILGASWFWLVGAVFLSQLPSFAKDTLGAGSGVVTLFLAAFSIGVGVGSVLCGRLMQGEISARYVPLAALGMAVFSLDLAFASEGADPASLRPAAQAAVGHSRLPVASGRDPHLRRPPGDRDLRRPVRRAALRHHPAAQRGGGARPHHRRRQHHERAVHDRRRRGHRLGAGGRAAHPRPLPRARRDESGRRAVDLPPVAAGHLAHAGADRAAAGLPGQGAGARTSGGGRRARRHRAEPRLLSRRAACRRLSARRADVRDRHGAGGALVGAPAAGRRRNLRDGPDPANGDQVADQGGAGRPAMRDLPGRPPQRHRRHADEDL